MNEGDRETLRIYSSGEVARRLGISSNLLRRYGLAWERLQGEVLPHLPGLGRFYPEDVVESLEDAKAWLEIRPEATVEDALLSVLGLQPAQAELSQLQESVSGAIAPLVEEVRGLRAEVHALKARLEGTKGELPPADAPTAEPAEGVETKVVEAELVDANVVEARVVEAEVIEDEAKSNRIFGRRPQSGYTSEPWPAPWREKKEATEADFHALEEEHEAEEEKDEHGFIGWFRRNF
jgi:hypothetical protein